MTNEQRTAADHDCDTCNECDNAVEEHCPDCHEWDDLDSIAALDREDVEAAIVTLRCAIAARESYPRSAERKARVRRVADALAEHLIDRHD